MFAPSTGVKEERTVDIRCAVSWHAVRGRAGGWQSLSSPWPECTPKHTPFLLPSLSLPPFDFLSSQSAPYLLAKREREGERKKEKHLYSASSLMSAAQASTCFVRNELLLIKNQQK